MKLEQAHLDLIEKYTKLTQKKGMHPNRIEMLKAGTSRDKIRALFGSLTELRKQAYAHKPSAFKGIVDEALFTPKAYKRMKSKAAKHKRFVVTTAVAGCEVHKEFLATIRLFCKANKALLLILPVEDPASINAGMNLDPTLAGEEIVFDNLRLNSNLFLSSIKLSAKQVDPVTGLARIGQRNGTFIYGSPKQRLLMTPTSNSKMPHGVMTTGAITRPNYKTKRYMSERTATLAQTDHVMGAVVVEVEDDRFFHYKQIQATKTGAFFYLDKYYQADTISDARAEYLVLGDWHSGETDPVARKAFVTAPDSVMNVLRPRVLVIHDGFNGRSISHHEVKNKVLRAQHAAKNHLSLVNELTKYAEDLNELASPDYIEEVVIVKSNHDEFLDRYLAEGRYIEDPQNHKLGAELAAAMIGGANPLRLALETIGLKFKSKIRWLDRDEDYKIARIELGSHGDKGANGARGSLAAMESAYGASVSGHSHTPGILRNAWQVGTTSLLKLSYSAGPSSWCHTACAGYKNGSRTLINSIKGRWRAVV